MLPFPAGEFIGGRFEVVEGPNESPGFVGGFSLVYLCLDRRRSNLPCALKTLRPELAGHETRKMLLQEGATVGTNR